MAGALLAGCGGSAHSSSSTTTRSATTTTTGAPSTGTAPAKPQPKATTETAINARIPVTFTIGPGAATQPATVSVPAALPIALTIVSGDAKPHLVALGTTMLRTPAGGRATALISELRPGRYRLRVDGSPRGTLVVGVQPGP